MNPFTRVNLTSNQPFLTSACTASPHNQQKTVLIINVPSIDHHLTINQQLLNRHLSINQHLLNHNETIISVNKPWLNHNFGQKTMIKTIISPSFNHHLTPQKTPAQEDPSPTAASLARLTQAATEAAGRLWATESPKAERQEQLEQEVFAGEIGSYSGGYSFAGS